MPEVAVSVLGEVYELGPHRLACGDSTDPEVWERLLGDERLQVVWTDPPYGVAYVGGTGLTIQNDDLGEDALAVFLRAAFTAAKAICSPGACWYVAAPPGPKTLIFALELKALGLFRQRLVWAKDRFVLGHSDYHYRHEDLYLGYVDGPGRRGRGGDGWFGDNAQDSVIEIARPSANREHPTMKPVALVSYCLSNSALAGWLVGDPFGGSGTTLIAAAELEMRARLIELDPRYCDVIRRRWTAWALVNDVDPGTGALE